MHFSIPDSRELNSENGSSYIGYNININGCYHCTVRYRQLHNLHEQLRRKCGSTVNLPPFPPKKLLPMTATQVLERRAQLENYLQALGQETDLLINSILLSFLRSAQQESVEDVKSTPSLDIYLMNGYLINIECLRTDQTNDVLNRLSQKINLPAEYIDYFGLFLIERNELSNDYFIIRKFELFESPYLSVQVMGSQSGSPKIYLRKSYWDIDYDLELMSHPVSLNLLYVQTISDIERNWVICNKQTLGQLSDLQSRGAKKQYLELARTLKYYGYMQFGIGICDYPEPNTQVIISIGKRELHMRLSNSSTKEGSFKVTRMRCWRITTKNSSRNDEPAILELSFEYLLAKNKLRWINISSPFSIFMSLCLQSIVDELLLKKNGPIRSFDFETNFSYMRRDGTRLSISKDSSSQSSFSIKNLLSKRSCNSNEFIENDAFEDIGDEDL